MASDERVAEPRISDLRVRAPVAIDGAPREIAASVYVPPDGVRAAAAPVLVLLPGGGYGRRYFDLPERGHHVRDGTIVSTIDRLGSGGSTSPPMEVSTTAVVAAANHAAVTTILDQSPLATVDIEAGIPMKTAARPWASRTGPGVATAFVGPGAVPAETASIEVPVLLAAGERDVTRPLLTEAAEFRAATDLAVFRIRRMAHMHNLGPTRHLLWERLGTFLSQATGRAFARSPGCPTTY